MACLKGAWRWILPTFPGFSTEPGGNQTNDNAELQALRVRQRQYIRSKTGVRSGLVARSSLKPRESHINVQCDAGKHRRLTEPCVGLLRRCLWATVTVPATGNPDQRGTSARMSVISISLGGMVMIGGCAGESGRERGVGPSPVFRFPLRRSLAACSGRGAGRRCVLRHLVPDCRLGHQISIDGLQVLLGQAG